MANLAEEGKIAPEVDVRNQVDATSVVLLELDSNSN
jgi:hypothetical protein